MLEPIIDLEAPISPSSGTGYLILVTEERLNLKISNPKRKHFSQSFIE